MIFLYLNIFMYKLEVKNYKWLNGHFTSGPTGKRFCAKSDPNTRDCCPDGLSLAINYIFH